ncbi:hypothetical protein GF314_06180 [bacterium]|nr:hypothetical protein [bacterium]
MLLAIGTADHAPAQAAATVEMVVAPDGGAPFSTLSGAVAAARPGTVIRVRPGVYTETVVIDKNLTLIGADGPTGTVLDGEHRRPLLRIVGPAVVQCENLELRHGLAASGPAVEVRGGAVVDFLDCTFHDNTAREHSGAVAAVGEGTWAEFVACHFQRNRAGGDGGALSARDGAEITLRGCTFFANEAGGAAGAIDVVSLEPLVVQQSLFIENQGRGGGAIRVAGGAVHLEANTFFRNVSFAGASTHVAEETDGSTVTVLRNIFCGDLEGAGLAAPEAATRACNLYYDNFRGPLLAGDPRPEELVANPEFCDFRGLDLTLRRNSPAAPGVTPDCGLIGALDVGCLESLEASGWSAPRAPHRLVR